MWSDIGEILLFCACVGVAIMWLVFLFHIGFKISDLVNNLYNRLVKPKDSWDKKEWPGMMAYMGWMAFSIPASALIGGYLLLSP